MSGCKNCSIFPLSYLLKRRNGYTFIKCNRFLILDMSKESFYPLILLLIPLFIMNITDAGKLESL